MSAEHKQTIEGLYAAFGRGDVPFIIGALDPEVEWWEADNFIYADKNPYRGPQSVLTGVFGRRRVAAGGFDRVAAGLRRRRWQIRSPGLPQPWDWKHRD